MSDTPPKPKLKRITDLKIAAIIGELASGKNLIDVAARYEVNRSWLSVRLSDPQNRAILEAIYTDTIDAARIKLPTLVSKAFDVMQEALSSPRRVERLRAAQAILNAAVKWEQPCRCNCPNCEEISKCTLD